MDADRLDRLITVTESLTAVVAGLDALDTRRGEDIDELREEVAALGAKVDALSVAVAALRDHTVGRESAPVDPVAQSRGQVKW